MTRPSIAVLALLALAACADPATRAAGFDEGTIFTFAPVGPRAFLTEADPTALADALRRRIEGAGPTDATRRYANRWIQPPGWSATVQAFGEPRDGDLYASRGYPYRTNLVDSRSGVIVLAYTREPPPIDVWKANQSVRVSGRLEGYARQARGIVILLDARLERATSRETNETPTS